MPRPLRLRFPDLEAFLHSGLKSRADIALFLMNANTFFIAGRILWKYQANVQSGFEPLVIGTYTALMLVIYLLMYGILRRIFTRHLPLGPDTLFWLLGLGSLYALVDIPFFLAPAAAALIFYTTERAGAGQHAKQSGTLNQRAARALKRLAMLSALLSGFFTLNADLEHLGMFISMLAYSFMLTFFTASIFYLVGTLLLSQTEHNQQIKTTLKELEEFRALEIRNLALEERAHLSRELHDTLGHNLTVVRLQTQIAYKLAQKSEASDPKLLESLSDAVEHGKEALQRLQEVVSALRHSDLEGKLVDTMRQTLGQWPGQVSFEVRGSEPELPHAHRLALLRAFQESLTNAYKYAYGEALTLRLVFEGGEGESPATPRATFSASNALRADHAGQEFAGEFSRGGLGLDGLRLRFGKLGGEVQVERTATTFGVVYTLPLPASAAAGNSAIGNAAAAEASPSVPAPTNSASPSPTSPQLRGTP